MHLTLLLLCACAALYLLKLQKNKKRSVPLPPGPPSDPIIGHLRTYPRVHQAIQLHEWSKTYGDVMYFNVLGKPIIVLSSEQAATDLLEKRSANYSDRPRVPAYELFSWEQLLVFTRYGPAFHQRRKLMQQPFTRQGCIMFQSTQLEQAHVFLKNLLYEPSSFHKHAQRFSASIIMEIAYAHQVKSDDDRYIRLASEVDDLVVTMGGAAMLNMFPLLKHLPAWFPGAWFVKYARDTQHIREEMINAPFEQVVRNMATGTARLSFASIQIEELERNMQNSDEDYRQLRMAAMHLWTAGVETTTVSVLTFILAMVLHPEVQKKAQREIDQVIGSRRLPDFDDRDSLPYVECVLQECRRWHQPLPLGVPHRAMEDDVYRGMFIPKGATIIANPRALAMDENVYRDPDSFRPERFLFEYGEPRPTSAFFGYGRRVCIGRYLADASVWIAAVSLLAAFDITKVRDQFGREITPDVKFTNSIVSHPEPFVCNIRPRTSQAKVLVEQL